MINQLYEYRLLLEIGWLSIKEYSEHIDNLYLENKDEKFENLLNDLEYISNDINKTIAYIDNFEFKEKLDFECIKRNLIKVIENRYKNDDCDIAALARECYNLWQVLPADISEEYPFTILSYIDDPLSCYEYEEEYEEMMDLFEEFIGFYK